MRLKSDFITQQIDDTLFIVPIGSQSFSGIVRNNKTAAFIVNCLKEDTTEQSIVEKMKEKYDAPQDVIVKDVHRVLETLKEIGAIEE